MKKDQIKKNVGTWVQLVPPAIRLDQHGLPLPMIDDWYVQSMATEGPVITNPRTRHVTTLGEDHIHSYTSNPDRSQSVARYGFLVLNVQLFIQGDKIFPRPTRPPGAPLTVQLPEIIEKVVKLDYPVAGGMQTRLEAEGYILGWTPPDRAAEMIDLKGYEEVIEPDRQGRLTRFRARDGLVLLKRRA